MTNLRYFTENGLDIIHSRMTEFFNKMKSEKSKGWLKEFCGKDPTLKSNYNFDFAFETNNFNPNEAECNNAIHLYELFKKNKLGNAVIYNEKFLAGFLYTFGYDYFIWKTAVKDETKVSATFFFDSRKGKRQAIARQLVSRLYKIVDMTIEEDEKDKYVLTKFVFENPSLRRMVYYPNMDGYNTSRGFVKAFIEIKNSKPDLVISSNIFETVRKEFSAFANANLIDAFTKEEIKDIVLEIINNI